MRHEPSSSGSVYNVKDPFSQTQKQQSACHSSSATFVSSSMASSVHYLQTPLKAPEEERWNGQPLFIAEDEEKLTSGRQSPMKLENAHVHFDGRMDAHAFPNTENIDPRLEAAALALSPQSAAGLGRARAGKRKSRVSSKVPIRVFSADAANFMAMVHNLTGLQSSTCLFPGTPQNPLLKTLPYRPLHPVVQGMLTPEFSAYPACNKTTSSLNTDTSPNTWSHSHFSSNQTVQLGSFHNSSPITNKSSSMQDGQTSAAILSSLWQPMQEYSRKNECCTDVCNVNKFPHENISGVGQKNRKQDQGPGREPSNWEGL